MNPSPRVRLSKAPATSAHMPMATPETMAVPPERLTAHRHSGSFALLYRTSNGSVDRPREALSAKEYVT